ncbi:MAG: hypothetical protein JKY19_14305 [Alcanivoracaceae bacterium]|nr:hypothetical protein [Alcanivoracaceae bacterium]
MLKIKSNEWFDLNKLGVIFTLLLMLFVLFFNVNIVIILVFELLLFLYLYTLYRSIGNNKSVTISINVENKWFVEERGEMKAMILKDYWLQTGRIFIWFKGSDKSISLLVSRSIIGVQTFSQLRAKIT